MTAKAKRPAGANQYRAALDQIGINQREAAVFVGVDERTSRRWALGEQPVPSLVAKVLRYMVRHDLGPEDFE